MIMRRVRHLYGVHFVKLLNQSHYYVEFSQSIYKGNQLTGFYVMETSAINQF